jgi:O-succinylbenzoic acid--CoA ligase
MVPMQVWNLLHDAEGRERLQQIRHLIIGGGAIDEALEQELQDFPNAVWSTYGMTETLSHIALRRINGPERSAWYTPLPGVQVSLNEEQCLVINAPAVCDKPLVTNDIGSLSPDPSSEGGIRFRILGRRDNVICSGGIKIQIEEVERLLKPHVHVPYLISKAPDERLGEQVVLLVEASPNPSEGGETISKLCQRVLPKYWQPRQVIAVDHIPLTETGKPARAEAERLSSLMLNV